MRSKFMKSSISIVVSTLAFTMIGCSSSGDSGVSNDIDPVTGTIFSGIGIDGILVGSTVCLDVNQNNQCDTDEPAAITGGDGKFVLPATTFSGPLLLRGGTDLSTNAPFTGSLKAPAGSTVVSPLTSAVQSLVESGNTPEEAQTKVKAAMGLSGVNVDLTTFDPYSGVNDANTDTALNAQKVLAQQTKLQVLVHAVSSSVAGANTNTSISDTMNSVFKEIVTKFTGSVVDLTETVITETIKNVATVIYADNTVAKVAATAVAETSATLAVNAASRAEETITNALTPSAATAALDEAIDNVNKAIELEITSNVKTVEIAVQKAEDANEDLETAAQTVVTSIEINTDLSLIASLVKQIEEDAKAAREQANKYSDAEQKALTAEAALAEAKRLAATVETNKEALFVQTQKDAIQAQADIAKQALSEARAIYTNAEGTKIIIENVSTLQKDINGLLTPTTAATVADAKNMFAQLRETTMTFVDLETPDANLSTIVGSQVDSLKTKVDPAVRAISTDFGDSATALQNSVDAFATSVESDFNATVTSIVDRLTAIDNATKNYNYTDDWSVTVGDDNISNTYSSDGVIGTEMFTMNGQTLTLTITANSDNTLTSVSKSGALSFAGTDYSLYVTNLSFAGTQASLVANGTMDGKNGGAMALTKLEISSGVNTAINDVNMFQNIAVKFEGEIKSGGRTLNGALALNEGSPSVLTGSYVGLSGEPTFSGEITLNTSFNALINDVANSANSYVSSYSPLLMVNQNGTQSFATHMTSRYLGSASTTPDANNNYTSYNSNEYNVTAQNGETVSCTVTENYSYAYYQLTGMSNTVTCLDGATLTPYYTDKDKVVAKVNGVDMVVDSARSNSYWSNNTTYSTQRIYFRNEGEAYVPNDGNLSLNGVPITVTDIRVVANKDLLDRTFDVKFDGTLTHGSKKIIAIAGIDRGAESKIYAQNIEVTDGESYVKMAELNVVMPNEDFLTLTDDNNNNDYYYFYNDGKSQFENYSIDYSTYYNTTNDGFELRNILSAKLDTLQLSLVDSDNETLKIEASVALENFPTNQFLSFSGMYEYRNAKFTGYADANGTTTNIISGDGDTQFTGTASLSGSVTANGFAPFDMTATANFAGNDVDLYTLLTRNASYKLGLHFTRTAATGMDALNIADSNGVLSSYVGSYNTPTSSNFSLKVVNKDGATLADFGEDVTGNGWEIKYSDNSSETLF